MSENKKSLNPGEPLKEEQLGAVSGGFGFEKGSVSNPIHHDCWFRAVGEPREDGRTKCISECKGVLDVGDRPVGVSDESKSNRWYICCCWGSDSCIDKWHKECGKAKRKYWER